MFKKVLSLAVIVCFFLTTLGPLPKAHADTVLGLPQPGTMVNLSPAYEPALIKGLTVHKDNPFLFDFIVDTGNSAIASDKLKQEGDRLVKYFFACLTIPEKDLWVNLSPYEKNRMIPDALGQTALGRDLLAEDYILKQLTASLIYPEKDLGKAFWDRVYAKAWKMYGTTQIPVNTFNKVWILADKASVYEHGQTAFVISGHLKVMLEEDYLALQKHSVIARSEATKQSFTTVIPAKAGIQNNTNAFGSQIVREIVLPEIEKEVNTGKNFATLRQIFNSLILATWYKKNLKEALLNQVYANKSTVKGVNLADPSVKEQIYQQYLKAYKKGVFNYIKEDPQPNGQAIPRKYFSGGFGSALDVNVFTNAAMGAKVRMNHAFTMATVLGLNGTILGANSAMTTDKAQSTDKYPVAAAYSEHKDNVIPRLSPEDLKNLRAIVGGKGFGLFDMTTPETLAAFRKFVNSSLSKERIREYLDKVFTDKPELLASLLTKIENQDFLDETKLRVPAGFTITTEQTGNWDLLMKQGPDAVNDVLAKLKEFLSNQGISLEGINDDLLKGITAEQTEKFFAYLASVENTFGKKLGAEAGMPLLIAVRSGARLSMPGMMDTILNLGLNDKSVEELAKATNPKFAWDSYRRFIEMFGRTVFGIEESETEKTGFKYILERMVHDKGKANEYELDADDYERLVGLYKEELKRQSEKFNRPMVVPQNPRLQYLMAIQTVMRSTFNNRALEYRRREGLKVEDTLSAVNIVPMVFGNRNEQSGSGVFFTRNLSTGEKNFNLEFAFNAQGEDVVSGRKAGQSLETMLADPQSQEVALRLLFIGSFLESKYGDVQDIEFTFEYDEQSKQNLLYILQTRNAKRTAMADVRTAVEMALEQIEKERAEGTLTTEREKKIIEAVASRINASALGDLLVNRFDPAAKKKAIEDGNLISQTGFNASPGAGVGRIVLDAETAEAWKARDEDVILVREETSPEDLGGMLAAKAILTTRGGRTSHAAVVARQFGIPAVVNISGMKIDFNGRTVTFSVRSKDGSTSELVFKEGDYLAVDGTGEGENGQVFRVSANKETREKELPLIPSIITTQQNKEEGVPILDKMITQLDSWISLLGDSDHDKNLKKEYEKYRDIYRKAITDYQSKNLTEEEESFYQQYKQLKQWANDIRKDKKALGVGANSEEPLDVLNAVLNGAERIGLVRTEHMFKGDRVLLVQKMMVSEGTERQKALDELRPFQQADFEQIFLLLAGRPATIRLIDPPLHEFLPKKDDEFERLARYMLGLNTDLKVDLYPIEEARVKEKIRELKPKIDAYKEDNPMIGTRGVRLSVLIPEIIEMQAQAIFDTMQRVKALGVNAKPEIMVPLVGNVEEFRFVHDRIVVLAQRLGIDRKDYKVGTMIEIIAGAENAVAIAKEADFFSFGTNDLTQTGLALSRDDGKEFLEIARLTGVFEADPFVSLIKDVAKFMERATLPVRAELVKRIEEIGFSFGVCGEQGVDVPSIQEYLINYLDYVSGNANRIPGALFISAQLALAGKIRIAGVTKEVPKIETKNYGRGVTTMRPGGDFKEQVESAVRYVESVNNATRAKKIVLALIKFPETTQELERLLQDQEFINGDDFQTVLRWAQELKREPAQPKDGTRMAVKVMTGSVDLKQKEVSDGVGMVTTEDILKTDPNVRFKIQEYLLLMAGSTRDKVKEEQALVELRRYLRQAMYDILGEGKPGLQTNISVRLPSMPLHSFFEYYLKENEETAIAKLAQELEISKEQVHERIEKYKESNPDIGERGSRVFFKKVAPFYIALTQTMILAAEENHYSMVNVILPFINNAKQISVIRNGYKDGDGNVIVPSLNEAVQDTVNEINAGVTDDKKIHVRIGAIIETPSAALDAKDISEQVDGPIFLDANNLTMTEWAAVARDVSRPTGFRDAYLRLKLWLKDIFRFAPSDVRNLLIEAIRSVSPKPGREVSLIGSNILDIELLEAAQYAGADSIVFPYDAPNPKIIQLGAIVAAAAAARVNVPHDLAMNADAAMVGNINLNRVIDILKSYPHHERINFIDQAQNLWVSFFSVNVNSLAQTLWHFIENALDEQKQGKIDVQIFSRGREVGIKISNSGSINFRVLREKALAYARKNQLRRAGDGTVKVVLDPKGEESSWPNITEHALVNFTNEELLWIEGLSTKSKEDRSLGQIWGGSGRGLNTARQEIVKENGRIFVESDEVKTSFTVLFQRGYRDFVDYFDDRAMAAAPRRQLDASTLTKSGKPLGGIDLNSANMGLSVTTDTNGGVQVNFDPAMIERIKAQGVFSADPVIIRITPMTPAQISPLLGLKASSQTGLAAV